MRRIKLLVAVVVLGTFVSMECNGASESDRPELARLCQKWEGTITGSSPKGSVRLSCDQIRRNWHKEQLRIQNEGTLFGEVRTLFEKVKQRDMREIGPNTFAAQYTCSIAKDRDLVVSCQTKNSDPPHSLRLIGTPSGKLKELFVSTDFGLVKKMLRRESENNGIAVSDAVLEYLVDLQVAVNSVQGGERERYSRSGDIVTMTATF